MGYKEFSRKLHHEIHENGDSEAPKARYAKQANIASYNYLLQGLLRHTMAGGFGGG